MRGGAEESALLVGRRGGRGLGAAARLQGVTELCAAQLRESCSKVDGADCGDCKLIIG